MCPPSSLPDEPSVHVSHPSRRGIIVVLAAVLMIVMMAMLAFSIDVGYMYTMQSQLQRSVDAATLAGAGSLVDGEDAARDSVHEYMVRNPVGTQWKLYNEQPVESSVDHFLANYAQGLDVDFGNWDAAAKQVTPVAKSPSSVQVRMQYDNMPFFFGHLLGRDSFSIAAESVASYQPRDIMVVLDLSGSMNDDSEFNAFNILGREAVEANQLQMYQDLGSPTYGNMEFTPQYAVAKGQAPQRTSQAQVTVEYRLNSVVVKSSKSFREIRVKRSNGGTVTYRPGGNSATLSPGGEVRYVWVTSGKNGNGSDQVHEFNFESNAINNTLKAALGLNTVDYPYNGSWDAYLNYCKSNSGQNKNASFRYKFGYQNLLNYWLEQRYLHSQTPDLWKVSAQPITAVKNAVDLFVGFMEEAGADDQLGLAVYNAPDGEGLLESALTDDFAFIMHQTNHRQAGHYHNYTNIAGGMKVAREELDARARAGSFKMIVLLTDGVANWTDGGVNSNRARDAVIEEAYLAADRGYLIVTISLGSGADEYLMQQVADIAKGTHFNVPGGRPVEEYAEDLTEVFKKIAAHRPLKLVK